MKNSRYLQNIACPSVILYFIVTFVEGSQPNSTHLISNYEPDILHQPESPEWIEKDYYVKRGNHFWSHLKLSDRPLVHRKSFTVFLDLLKKRKDQNRFHPRYGEKNGRDSWTPKSRFRHHNHTYGLKLTPMINLKSNFTRPISVEDKLKNISHDSNNRSGSYWNIIPTSQTPSDPVDPGQWRGHSSGTMDSVTVSDIGDHTNSLGGVHTHGNHSVSLLDKMITWKNAQKRKVYDLVKESPLWIGVGAGVCSSVILVVVISAIYMLFRRRRSRCSKLNELSLGTPKDDKPIYIKLSQLHRPKRSPNYVVTVLDESNFSINSDEDSSEEELFDLSDFAPGSPCKTEVNNKINLDYQNINTSTPKKKINRAT